MAVPAADWLLHPWRSGRVARLLRADDPEAARHADACRECRRTDGTVARAARAIAAMIRSHGRDGDRLRTLEREVDALEERVHVSGHRPGRFPHHILVRGHGGRPVTVGIAARECDRLHRQLDQAVDLDHHGTVSRLARTAGAALLAVDVVALFLIFARLLNLDWAAPEAVPLVGSSVFSVIGAGTMAKIAVVLGDRLWVWRRSGPRGVIEAPARGGLVGALGAALAMLSLGTGVGILLRILEDAAVLELGLLGPVLGIVVGTAGLAAPWLIVVQRAHDGTEVTRTLAGLVPIVVWTSRRLLELEQAQDRARARRRRCREHSRLRLERAERTVERHRRRHDEVVQRARAAGAQVDDEDSSPLFETTLAPLRELLASMDPML